MERQRGFNEIENVTSTNAHESQPSIPVQVKVYKRRWWILFLYAGIGFMQCGVWNTWGPITDSAKAAYHSWSDAEIGLFSMWGTITMILGLVPFTIMLQKQGLRTSIVVTSGLLAAGTGIRLFATEEMAFTILAHIGAILNGFAGIIIGIAPSLLSSTWFPPHERTTATGIACTFNQLGNSGGFFIGPLIVREPRSPNASNISYAVPYTIDVETELIQKSIRDYMWLTAAVCIPFFLCCLAYFPDKPKRPPSLTSAIHPSTNSVLQDIGLLIRNWNFLLLVIPYSLTLGVNVAWSSVLDINLGPMGISQHEASLIGVYMTFGGVLLAILASRFTDLLYGYIKLTLLTLLLISSLFFIWFLFLMNHCLPFDKTQIFVSSTIGASFGYACSPLFFELAVELAYPVSEGVVGGFLTFCWNILAAIFLVILQLGVKNVLWMDYALALQAITAFGLLLFVKEEYKRSNLDQNRDATVTIETRDEGSIFGELFRSGNSYGALNI